METILLIVRDAGIAYVLSGLALLVIVLERDSHDTGLYFGLNAPEQQILKWTFYFTFVWPRALWRFVFSKNEKLQWPPSRPKKQPK